MSPPTALNTPPFERRAPKPLSWVLSHQRKPGLSQLTRILLVQLTAQKITSPLVTPRVSPRAGSEGGVEERVRHRSGHKTFTLRKR